MHLQRIHFDSRSISIYTNHNSILLVFMTYKYTQVEMCLIIEYL